MECDICLEDYNQVERVPKIVPCGHTVCLRCLEQSDRKECPTCRWEFEVAPDALRTNFALLRLIERPDRPSRGWCSDCRASAAPRCWEDHEVLAEKSALRRHLQGTLRQVPGQLEDLQDLCQGEQVGQALTLLTAESWSLTLQSGAQELTGTVTNTEDPLTQLMWLLVAAKTGLTKSRVEAPGPPPPAASPPPAAPGPAPPEALPVREMDVDDVSSTKPNERQQDKAALLAAAPGVTRLVNLWCHRDVVWSLKLLQRAAPTLERLDVTYPCEAHLRASHAIAMPRLRRLRVRVFFVDSSPFASGLPALPPGHAGLQWLSVRVRFLRDATTQSLLRAHGGTLEQLELGVGTPGCYEWPFSCGDLHSLLQQSGLRALRRLVLLRGDCKHEAAACSQQRAEVRRVLPGAEVLCSRCDGVEREEV